MYVGIDVSKEKFDACGIGDEGKKLFSLSCSMNRDGFDKFVMQLTKMSMRHRCLSVWNPRPVTISPCFRILPQKATGLPSSILC